MATPPIAVRIRRALAPVVTVLAVAALSFGASALAATFNEPSGAPPSNNAYAPLDTSGNTNVKSGALGVGGATPPSWAMLDVGGALSVSGDGGSGWGVITSEAGSRPLVLKARGGDNPDVFINTNGNVGVGTASPSGKLDVEGGQLCLNGACYSSLGGSLSASLGPLFWYHPGCSFGGECSCPTQDGNQYLMVGVSGFWASYTDVYYLCRQILN